MEKIAYTFVENPSEHLKRNVSDSQHETEKEEGILKIVKIYKFIIKKRFYKGNDEDNRKFSKNSLELSIFSINL